MRNSFRAEKHSFCINTKPERVSRMTGMGKRILTIMLILTLGSALGAACKKKSKVPTKEEYLKISLSDPDQHGMKELDFDGND